MSSICNRKLQHWHSLGRVNKKNTSVRFLRQTLHGPWSLRLIESDWVSRGSHGVRNKFFGRWRRGLVQNLNPPSFYRQRSHTHTHILICEDKLFPDADAAKVSDVASRFSSLLQQSKTHVEFELPEGHFLIDHLPHTICILYWQFPLGSFPCIIIGPEPLKHAFFPIDFVREIAYRIIPSPP